MCGDSIRAPSLGGALAVLNATYIADMQASFGPLSSASGSACTSPMPSPPVLPLFRHKLSGSLVFHTQSGSLPGASGRATHATFTPAEDCEDGDLMSCVVGIHTTGNLMASALESPIMHRIPFQAAQPALDAQRRRSMRVALPTPLDLGVGGDGIIGRRVSVWRGEVASGVPLAEGVVGFN